MTTETKIIKASLKRLGFVCKVRQNRFCMHVFLTQADRLNPARMATIDFMLSGIGMVPQGTPGRHLPTNIYSVQPIFE